MSYGSSHDGPYGLGVCATNLRRFAVIISGLSGSFSDRCQQSGRRSASHENEPGAGSQAEVYHLRRQV
ncbi:hypothetical protein PAXRUDRAFT_304488 [Paxillus rubicundulus Ve08.2h10]|uniref:Uncharacterized protein n=1 Tax=Paxillus rubicundulus Ve08.2h10 TaxID=930991 RepID=A0A0D0DDT8_9AGAM|nr:hypothetical protein PAXRUDRAFT_304488 [Paxillus rubicundulus Ve08.2h10]